MAEALEHMQRELEERPATPYERSSRMITKRSNDGEFLRVSLDLRDNEWKLVSFHSPRFTNQCYESDGIAKLKDNEQPKTYRPKRVDDMSSVGKHLMEAASI